LVARKMKDEDYWYLVSCSFLNVVFCCCCKSGEDTVAVPFRNSG
jgi:hypothetical protein